jgi:peptide/nickel transport system substrate-binding protein/oligopeptide transport system substrate-binding protein
MLGAAAALIVGVSACGGSGEGANAPSGVKTLRWLGLAGTATWANTLDPAMVTDSISNGVIGMVDAGLVKLLPNGNPAPNLAKSWTVSDKGLTYTFHLRPHLTFSNGDRLTAQDVAWSIERALNPATKSPVALAYLGHIQGAADYNSGKASTVTGLKVVNPTTLRITLDQPIAFFLKTLTYPTADVLDPKIVKGHPSQTYITENCGANVGAGQFVFKCRGGSGYNSFYSSGTTPSMTLVPNKRYWGAKPKYDVYMPAIAEAQTNYKEFEAGGIDATGIPSTDVSANKGKAGYYQYPTSVVDYMTPNETSAPFDNIHCRLVLAYAINRAEISKILHDTEVPTYAVVPRGMLGYYAGANNPHYNLAKAKAELAQCPGGLNGLTITYQHTSVDVDDEYTAIQNMLQQAGANVKIQGLSFNGWLEVVGQPLAKTGTKVTENLWIEDYPDPYDYLTLLLRAGENYDIGGFDNATYNHLVDEASTDQNPVSRAALYRKAQHVALSQGAWISVGNSNGYALVNPKIHGFVGSPALGLIPKGDNWANISWS